MLQFAKPLATNKYSKLLKKIDVLATACDYLPATNQEKQYLIHLQTLKSSLFSAKIEGNTLSLNESLDSNLDDPKEKNKLELSNLLKTQKLTTKLHYPLEKKHLKNLHQLIMNNLDHRAGKFRHQASAIFDGFGNIVYLTPEPKEMKLMLTVFFKEFNQKLKWQQKLFKAAACHYYFEKIHPFVDGNGRVGRILLKFELQNISLLKNIPLAIEEYFAQYRTDYYYYLEKNTRNLAEFTQFFLKGVIWSLKKFLAEYKNIKQRSKNKSNLNLLPRRLEILNIITDHPYISLNNINRRFPDTPRRTIAYDVKQLIEKKLVKKHGQTRGACYTSSRVPVK